ncbi:MAG: methyltransferase domain-containing protein [Desulfobacteraceae bacterium]|nr:methyltransferase domain-containing protein [Desulfobacteraceae bacterium]
MNNKNYELIKEIRELYKNNQNIIQHISEKYSAEVSKTEAISYSYDLQAGSYYDYYKNNSEVRKQKVEAGKYISSIFSELEATSVLDCGTGEATSLGDITLHDKSIYYSGFDISLSRILYAKKHLSELSIDNTHLFVADMMSIPYQSSSFDVVFTFHAIEPNQNSEKQILEELIRVSRRFLVLVEPSYELSCDEQRIRMDKHGYCRNLCQYLEELGCNIVKYELMELYSNPLNKPAIIIAEVPKGINHEPQLVSPVSLGELAHIDSFYCCNKDGFLFPIFNGIPVMLQDSAILCTHFDLH